MALRCCATHFNQGLPYVKPYFIDDETFLKGKLMTRSEKAFAKICGKAAEHRITMTELADTAGITRVTLSNWRAGRTVPLLEIFLAVEEALDQLIAEKQSV